MDDVAEKREARRRRILENSQKRLEKITGIEQKSSAAHFPAFTADDLAAEPLNTGPDDTPPPPPPPLPKVESQPMQTSNKKREHVIIIAALAMFVNYYTIILEKIFDNHENVSGLRSIFLPILAYEVIELFTKPAKSQSSNNNNNLVQQLLVQRFRNAGLEPLLHCLLYTLTILQDVLLYFFFFVCCFICRQLWPWNILKVFA